MERSALALYSPELLHLRDCAMALGQCLSSPPQRLPRERETAFLLRAARWRSKLWSCSCSCAIGPWIEVPNLCKALFLENAYAMLGMPTRLEYLIITAGRIPGVDNCSEGPSGGFSHTVTSALTKEMLGAVGAFEANYGWSRLQGEVEEEIAIAHVALQRMPKWTMEGTGDETARDERFIEWHDNEGLGPAGIRDRWNKISDEERMARFPKAWNKFESYDGDDKERKKKDRAYQANRISHIVGAKRRSEIAKKAVI